jgi:hypothetical protein
MTEYLISEELRDSIIGLLILLQKHSEKQYHKYSGSYTNRILLDDGKELKLPYLSDLQTDLENLDEVIETGEYDAKAEEFIMIAKQMGIL